MRMNGLDLRVVVRRVSVGSAPYSWEIRAADGVSPVQISPGRFRSMETALQEGQAWLADFLSKQPPKRRSSQVAQVALAYPAAELADDPDEEDDTQFPEPESCSNVLSDGGRGVCPAEELPSA
jgi:hypothetical protein